MKNQNTKSKLTAADEKLVREIAEATGPDNVSQLKWFATQLRQQSKNYARVAALKLKNPRLWRDLGLQHLDGDVQL